MILEFKDVNISIFVTLGAYQDVCVEQDMESIRGAFISFYSVD